MSLKFLSEEIGSAKENLKEPIHNWYKFTAGFSFRLVNEILSIESKLLNEEVMVYDPFAGCGTTLVSCQKKGVTAFGNEGQNFMYDIIRAKLNWGLENDRIKSILNSLLHQARQEYQSVKKSMIHELLWSLYTPSNIKKLYALKRQITFIEAEDYRLFFQLALSQTLHKTSNHPIAAPYIVRNKTFSDVENAFVVFESVVSNMCQDLLSLSGKVGTAKIFLHDSRRHNREIRTGLFNTCITSPPYLNNLDYGEVSKVHSHFFGYTENWNEITEKVRKKLVTSATTHYSTSDFDIDGFKNTEFAESNDKLMPSLLKLYDKIHKESKGKSFDILTLLYFKDMFEVLKETNRVLQGGGRSYLVVGDSAPYNVFVPTTQLLGKIAMSCGFLDYKTKLIRTRGTKWKNLKYRHSRNLSENLLILQK